MKFILKVLEEYLQTSYQFWEWFYLKATALEASYEVIFKNKKLFFQVGYKLFVIGMKYPKIMRYVKQFCNTMSRVSMET